MDKNAKVTVVTGYYNREDYVDESIQSLLNQDYDNYDIVIFDDASTDNTFQRLKLFQENNSKIKLIRHSNNIGFVQGIINAISNIDSEYIAIHGSGDISLPERIREQANYLDENPSVGVVSSRTQSMDVNGTIINNRAFKSNVVTTDDLVEDNRLAHGATMFRSKEYHKVGGYRSFFTFGQDRDLWLRMSLESAIHIIPKFLYIKVEGTNAVSTNINKIIIQMMSSSFSSQLIEMRKAEGYDFIDKYGEKASLLFNPKTSTNKINKLMLLQYFQNKEENMNFLMEISRSINDGYLNKIFINGVKFSYKVKFLRELLSKAISFKLGERIVKDHKSISN